MEQRVSLINSAWPTSAARAFYEALVLEQARAAGARLAREGAETFWGGY